MRKFFIALVTFSIIFIAAVVAYGLVISAPIPKQVEPEEVARSIRVVEIEKQPQQLIVRSQGTVSPKTQSEIIPEVSGRIQWISPNLVSGGFVKKGEVLLKIDDRDYGSKVQRSEASVARAQAEDEHARFELNRQKELVKKKLISQSKLEAQLRLQRIAAATLKEAEVGLEQAQRDLLRTEISAPYDGFVRTERVDPGQFISRGQTIASVYASDSVEIRLPIADSQLAYLDLPLGVRGELPEEIAPRVTLSTNYGGQHYEWQGKLVRTEAEIDSRSRMVYAIARVNNQLVNTRPNSYEPDTEQPKDDRAKNDQSENYQANHLQIDKVKTDSNQAENGQTDNGQTENGQTDNGQTDNGQTDNAQANNVHADSDQIEIRQPENNHEPSNHQQKNGQLALPVGLFVQAYIEGRRVENIVSLPRTALRNENQVLVVDRENRLRFRDIEMLKFDQNQVLISGGLKEGELVNISPIQTVIDGMMVKPVIEGES